MTTISGTPCRPGADFLKKCWIGVITMDQRGQRFTHWLEQYLRTVRNAHGGDIGPRDLPPYCVLHGIDPRQHPKPKRFKPASGHWGCLQAHLQGLQRFRDMLGQRALMPVLEANTDSGYIPPRPEPQWIFVFEDDVCLAPDFWDDMAKILAHAPADADVVRIGVKHWMPPRRLLGDMLTQADAGETWNLFDIPVKATSTYAQCYPAKKETLDRIIASLEQATKAIDLWFCHAHALGHMKQYAISEATTGRKAWHGRLPSDVRRMSKKPA